MERGEKREQEIPEKYHHSLFTPGFSLLFVARITRLSLYLSLSRKSSPLPFARLSRSPILACSPTSDFFFSYDGRYRRPYLPWKRSRRVRAPGFFFYSPFSASSFLLHRVFFFLSFFHYFLLNVFVRVIGNSP